MVEANLWSDEQKSHQAIIALIFTPTLVGKWNGMYKLNLRGWMECNPQW